MEIKIIDNHNDDEALIGLEYKDLSFYMAPFYFGDALATYIEEIVKDVPKEIREDIKKQFIDKAVEFALMDRKKRDSMYKEELDKSIEYEELNEEEKETC